MALEEKFAEVENNEFYSAAYQRFLAEGKLIGSKCRTCGHVCVPPEPICPRCYGGEMVLEEMKGKGRLLSYTVIAVAPPLMVEEGYDRNNPYCSGIVELEEGAKVPARIVNVNVRNPEKIELGMGLSIKYLKVGQGNETKTFLAFEPTS